MICCALFVTSEKKPINLAVETRFQIFGKTHPSVQVSWCQCVYGVTWSHKLRWISVYWKFQFTSVAICQMSRIALLYTKIQKLVRINDCSDLNGML